MENNDLIFLGACILAANPCRMPSKEKIVAAIATAKTVWETVLQKSKEG